MGNVKVHFFASTYLNVARHQALAVLGLACPSSGVRGPRQVCRFFCSEPGFTRKDSRYRSSSFDKGGIFSSSVPCEGELSGRPTRPEQTSLSKIVNRRGAGQEARAAFCTRKSLCARCVSDQAFLRSTERPQPVAGGTVITAADLFAGCGGMTLGLQEAARRGGWSLSVRLAVDSDEEMVALYRSNFPAYGCRCADVESIFDGLVSGALTYSEETLLRDVGSVDILMGGPPCQGHSDLNNHTRRKDPKNALVLCIARAAQVLLPRVVIIENVAAVQHDTGQVVRATSAALMACGYAVAGMVLDLRRLGVPQRRKRFVLIASTLPSLDPADVLDRAGSLMSEHSDRTVRWAIRDLMNTIRRTPYDTPSEISDENRRRMKLLFQKRLFDLPNRYRPECHRDRDHTYNSMYGRLRWDLPAQTITTGFGSMGQGRYVHPQRPRTLTPHEGARLQTFPDWFQFGESRRGVLAKAIGNAVPPLLLMNLGAIIMPAIAAAKTADFEQQRKRA